MCFRWVRAKEHPQPRTRLIKFPILPEPAQRKIDPTAGSRSVTSTDYENPYRPLPIRAFNRFGRAGRRLGVSGRLEVDSLIGPCAAEDRADGLR